MGSQPATDAHDQRSQPEIPPLHVDRGGLPARVDFLGIRAPALGSDESRAEILRPDARRKGQASFRAMVLVAAGREENPEAGHGPGVMVAAFDFVPRIA